MYPNCLALAAFPPNFTLGAGGQGGRGKFSTVMSPAEFFYCYIHSVVFTQSHRTSPLIALLSFDTKKRVIEKSLIDFC